MISQTSEESITAAPPGAEKEPKQNSRPRRLSARTFDFLWKRDSRRESASKKEENQRKREDLIEVKIVECKLKNAPAAKMSFDFFRNIKKHMQIKSLTMCKSKQKTKEIGTSSLQSPMNQDSLMLLSDRSTIPAQENSTSECKCENTPTCSVVSCNNVSGTTEACSWNEHFLHRSNQVSENCSDVERNREMINAKFTDKTETDDNYVNVPTEYESCSTNGIQELQYNTTVENKIMEHQTDDVKENTETQSDISEAATNDYRVKASLTEELLKLSKYGWYWGPISGDEADAKLVSEPDGAFLVRDSSDDRYVLTLSFKSSGKLLHARMEHSGGLFSLCNQSESEGFTSVAALINHSMNFSQSAVFCYSRPKYPGHPSFPVRLTKPVSRFTQVRSLQYLCRFVIRQNTRLDNIHKLPLPKTIKGYIEEAHY